MHTIKLQVDDTIYKEIVKSGINIQDELKSALYKLMKKKDSTLDSYMNSEQYANDKEYFNDALDEIESGDAKLLNQEEYDKEMNGFMKSL